jgi:hypothetical protein
LARLTFAELARGVSGIGDVHGAIASRVFNHVGRAGMARFMHDAISSAMYTGIGACTASVGGAASHALSVSGSRPERSLSPTPLGGGLIGAIDGLIGDELEQKRSVLQEPISVRVGGRAVACRRAALAHAFPDATRRIVVFVHGLMGTEFRWSWWSAESGGTYGTRLAGDLNMTAVYVRYNTGRHISENGRSLAELLERMVAARPVELDEVALIGHSMGELPEASADPVWGRYGLFRGHRGSPGSWCGIYRDGRSSSPASAAVGSSTKCSSQSRPPGRASHRCTLTHLLPRRQPRHQRGAMVDAGNSSRVLAPRAK